MTTMTLPRAEAAAGRRAARTPFTRLVRVELRKLYDTRAGFWLLVAILGVTAATMLIGLLTLKPSSRTLDGLLGLAGIPQSVLLPVLGIMAVTGEWGQRTGLVTFTLEPRRGRVLAAKVAAALLVGVAAMAIVVALGGALYSLAGTGGWTLGAEGFGELLLGQSLGVMLGLAFGTLLLNTPMAISAYFALPLVWTVALSFGVAGSETIKHWFDTNSSLQPLFNHEMTGQAWAQLATSHAVWVLLPLAVGVLRVLLAEVKSS